MIDSHAHIYLKQFDNDRQEMIERANTAGISRIYMPNIDRSSIDNMLEIEEKFPAVCIPMMGLHPSSVKKGFEKELYEVENWLAARKWSAVGEIGLDLYWDQSTLEIQKEALRIQILWAKEYDLPIVLHCREAFKELFDLLDEVGTDDLSGVFHCFTGSREDLEKINEMDFHIGLGGVITFKKNDLSEMTDIIRSDRIMLETDSPYLSPVPFRGKRNEPAYLEYISGKLAELLNMNKDDLISIIDSNTTRFFASTHVQEN